MRVYLALAGGCLGLGLLCGQAMAQTRQMECREWVDKKYRGLYTFSFDQKARKLAVDYKPEGENFLFGRGVTAWTLLWAKDGNAVFYGIEESDWTAPVKILSLDFAEVNMFTYGVASAIESSIVVSITERKCRRLD